MNSRSSRRVDRIELLERQPLRPADHERQVSSALASTLQPAAERDRVQLHAVAIEHRHERPLRHALRDLLLLPHLDQLQPRVPRQELLIVLDVIREWWAQSAHGDDDDPHDGILRADG
jgi:hypothetical protein